MKATDFSGKWDEFMLQLSKEELAGAEQPPQLLLCCQDGAMSVRLAGGIPDAARAMLAGEVETIGFDDGRGAVRFPLRAGGDILGFLGLLGQGNYGTERLVIKNGIALRLPVADRQRLRQSLGLQQIFAVGPASRLGQETFIWW
ncbi:MAG TPA: hypothetical protein PK919_07225 [Candidatus Aminicenantes bacterium]|nr:hypothetical protein [Candidatus Aminicenantes bacterium]